VIRRALTTLLLLACLGLAARGDVVVLTSGAKLEGEVVAETREHLVVRTAGGTTAVPRRAVARVERRGLDASTEAEYRSRLARTDRTDAEERHALGLWLLSVGADDLARGELQAALALDPNHAFAKEALLSLGPKGTPRRARPAAGGCHAPARAPQGEPARPAAEPTPPTDGSVAMKLGYVILYVRDVAKSVDFYERAFGLGRRFIAEDKYGELATGETTLAFASHAQARSNLPRDFVPSSPKGDPQAIEVAFVTADVRAAYELAVAAGATAVVPPTAKPWGQIVAYVRDIDGFLVELCSPVAPTPTTPK